MNVRAGGLFGQLADGLAKAISFAACDLVLPFVGDHGKLPRSICTTPLGTPVTVLHEEIAVQHAGSSEPQTPETTRRDTSISSLPDHWRNRAEPGRATGINS